MTVVDTQYGPGEIVGSSTVRGRRQFEVAGQGFRVWVDESKVPLHVGAAIPAEPGHRRARHQMGTTHEAWAPVDFEHSVDLPYDPTPQYPALPGDTESTIQPIHEIDPEERLSPADSITFNDRTRDESERRGDPGPNPDLFAKGAARYADYDDEGEFGGVPGVDDQAYGGAYPAEQGASQNDDPTSLLERTPGWQDKTLGQLVDEANQLAQQHPEWVDQPLGDLVDLEEAQDPGQEAPPAEGGEEDAFNPDDPFGSQEAPEESDEGSESEEAPEESDESDESEEPSDSDDSEDSDEGESDEEDSDDDGEDEESDDDECSCPEDDGGNPFEKSSGWQHNPEMGEYGGQGPAFGNGLQPDPEAYGDDYPHVGEGNWQGDNFPGTPVDMNEVRRLLDERSQQYHNDPRLSSQHAAQWQALVPLIEGLGGEAGTAGGASVVGGEAGTGGGLGGGMVKKMLPGMGGGGDEEQQQQDGQGGPGVPKIDPNNPLPLPGLGYGWGDLVTPKNGSVHQGDWRSRLDQLTAPPDYPGNGEAIPARDWLAQNPAYMGEEDWEDKYRAHEPPPGALHVLTNYRPAGLSDKYIDITADADYHNSPILQFRHDPVEFIQRRGHVANSDGMNPRFAEYMDLVEADKHVREAAWKDVRTKALRLRREGNVQVEDVGPDRIYATVKGDHGVYETMIAKKGSFGGLGGGHTISNWHCSCEWGKWAFQRRYTFVGRLCSHGYATYLTMQSEHMKGKPRQPRQVRAPKRRKRADALQMVPQRLTPELVVNDTDDAQQFRTDVTKDERKETGPADIVHFSKIMAACDYGGLPYPHELVAYLTRTADDPPPTPHNTLNIPVSTQLPGQNDKLPRVNTDKLPGQEMTDSHGHGWRGIMDNVLDQFTPWNPGHNQYFEHNGPGGPMAPEPGKGQLDSAHPSPDPNNYKGPAGTGADYGIPEHPKLAPGSGTDPAGYAPAPAGAKTEVGNEKNWTSGGFGDSGKWTPNTNPNKINTENYDVLSGDTTDAIAQRSGLSTQQLQQANPGKFNDPNLITPGRINTPGAGTSTPGTASPNPPTGTIPGPGAPGGPKLPDQPSVLNTTPVTPSAPAAGMSGATAEGSDAVPHGPAVGPVGGTPKITPAVDPKAASFERQVLRAAGFSKRRRADKVADPNPDPDAPAPAAGAKPPGAKPAVPGAKPAAPGVAPATDIKTVTTTPGTTPKSKPKSTTPGESDPDDPDAPTQEPAKKQQQNGMGDLGSMFGGGGMGGGMGSMMGLMGDAASGMIPAVTQGVSALTPAISQGVSGLVNGLGGLTHLFGHKITADGPYRPGEHEPFAGSGPAGPLLIHDSESNVKDNYSSNLEDVQDLGSYDLGDQDSLEALRIAHTLYADDLGGGVNTSGGDGMGGGGAPAGVGAGALTPSGGGMRQPGDLPGATSTGAGLPTMPTMAASVRHADDQKREDWVVHSPSEATPEINRLRNWADDSQESFFGDMADHVDDVQRTVEDAYDKGVAASPLVASYHPEYQQRVAASPSAQAAYGNNGGYYPQQIAPPPMPPRQPRGGGIARAGKAPTRAPVIPEVVREVIPRGQQRQGQVERLPDLPDPYSKTAADFRDDDEPSQQYQAAYNPNEDPVARFQRSAAASDLMASNGGGSDDGGFDIAAAAQAHLGGGMQRTAGRNFSLAEQDALMNESHPQGARNLASLDLEGTHYEAEHSVGLF